MRIALQIETYLKLLSNAHRPQGIGGDGLRSELNKNKIVCFRNSLAFVRWSGKGNLSEFSRDLWLAVSDDRNRRRVDEARTTTRGQKGPCSQENPGLDSSIQNYWGETKIHWKLFFVLSQNERFPYKNSWTLYSLEQGFSAVAGSSWKSLWVPHMFAS